MPLALTWSTSVQTLLLLVVFSIIKWLTFFSMAVSQINFTAGDYKTARNEISSMGSGGGVMIMIA